jgi:hypothetical protein
MVKKLLKNWIWIHFISAPGDLIVAIGLLKKLCTHCWTVRIFLKRRAGAQNIAVIYWILEMLSLRL